MEELNIADKLSKQITDYSVLAQKTLDEKFETSKAEVAKIVAEKLEGATREIDEKLQTIEARLATANQSPAIIHKRSLLGDNDARLREKLKGFMTKNGPDRQDKLEIKLYEDEAAYAECQQKFAEQSAFADKHATMKDKLNFASTLTGGGLDRGGRIEFAPWKVSRYMGNPLWNMASTTMTTSASYTYRFKYGLSGYRWSEPVDQTNAAGTTTIVAWALPLKDFNVRFDIRELFLADANAEGGGFEGILTSSIGWDQEAGAFEAQAQHVNNDQSGTGSTVSTGGADGPRSLCGSYGIAGNPAFSGGAFVPAAWASGATVSTNTGLHSLATVDATVTSGIGNTFNLDYATIFSAMNQLPQQYWTGGMKDNLVWYIHPLAQATIRNLRDTNGTPMFDRTMPGIYPGYIGTLAGIPVIVSRYLHQPVSQTAVAGTQNLYPIWLADFSSFTSVVRSLTFSIRRFTETVPGSVTFFADTRSLFSTTDIFSGIRIRSTSTASTYTTNALNPGQ